jgi:hypothetical protein
MTSLEQAAQEFNIWRNTRTKRAKTPSHLVELVKSLVNSYKRPDILRALKISHFQLRKYTDDGAESKAVHFVELPAVTPGIANCELKRTDGATLKMQVPTHQLASVFQAFLCCK